MKKNIVLIIFLVLVITPAAMGQNQTCDCDSDIAFLDKRIRKTPAYKNNKKAYLTALQKVSKSEEGDISAYACFEKITQLLLRLRDAHARVYGKAVDSLNMDFPQHPKSGMNVDSLYAILENKPFDAIEGIYKSPNGFTLGIVYLEKRGVYQAIVLNNDDTRWRRGDIFYTYIPYGKGFLLGYGGQYATKRYINYTERIQKGVMLGLNLQKDPGQKTYFKSPYPKKTYFFEELSDDTDYLKLGSFNSYYPILGEAESFYSSLQGKLNKPNLIVDLRGNSGGGERNSDLILKPLMKYLDHNKVYLIMGHNTRSNAERFAIKVQQHRNVTAFGERTSGALAYEIKNSTYTLPSSGFTIILTSKLHRKFLPYELIGVVPDHYLNYNESWIKLVQDFISAKTKDQ